MTHDILLATKNRDLSRNFRNAMPKSTMRLDTVDSPNKLNKIFHQRGQIVEVAILDGSSSEKDLKRYIFYIKQYRKDIPVLLVNLSHTLGKQRELIRNLYVHGFYRQPSSKKETQEILKDLEQLLQKDRDKKFDSVEFLNEEKVFACTFQNKETFFLKAKDIPDYDGAEPVQSFIDKERYHFTIRTPLGGEYVIPWDYVRHLYDEKYEYHKSKASHAITSEEIAKRIVEFRKIKNLTQEQLADKTGILRANIARIESGKHYPSLVTLEKVAKALQMPVVSIVSK